MKQETKNRIADLFMDLYRANEWIHSNPDKFKQIEELWERAKPKIEELKDLGVEPGFSIMLLILPKKDVQVALEGFKKDLDEL